MNQIRSTHSKERKLARLIAAAWLVLAWIAAALFSEALPINRRHIKQRYRWLNLDRIAGVIACLVVARAGHLMHKLNARSQRDYARAGFARRMRRGHMLRTLIGARLRKALKYPNVTQRYARLLHVLTHIDLWTQRMIRRLHRGTTRIRPLIAVRPPHQPARSVARLCAPALNDSS